MKLSNICPVCRETLSSFICGNENCKHCSEETPFERLKVISQEDNIIECPHCGFQEHFEFWELQNIEILIATQVPTKHPGSLVEAGKLATRRADELEARKVKLEDTLEKEVERRR